MSNDNVIGLDGKPITPPAQTDPVIIELIEGALAAAKAGHMTGLAIVTIMAPHNAATAFQADAECHAELLGVTRVLEYRQLLHLSDQGKGNT